LTEGLSSLLFDYLSIGSVAAGCSVQLPQIFWTFQGTISIFVKFYVFIFRSFTFLLALSLKFLFILVLNIDGKIQHSDVQYVKWVILR